MTSAFRSAGQRCSALRLLCLQEDIFAPALAMLEGATRELRVGDPGIIGVHVGPVIDAQAKARLDAYIAECAAQTRVIYAGTAPDLGSFVAPHIILIERAGDLTTEIFGPVLHVMKWRAGDFSALVREIAAIGFWPDHRPAHANRAPDRRIFTNRGRWQYLRQPQHDRRGGRQPAFWWIRFERHWPQGRRPGLFAAIRQGDDADRQYRVIWRRRRAIGHGRLIGRLNRLRADQENSAAIADPRAI